MYFYVCVKWPNGWWLLLVQHIISMVQWVQSSSPSSFLPMKLSFTHTHTHTHTHGIVCWGAKNCSCWEDISVFVLKQNIVKLTIFGNYCWVGNPATIDTMNLKQHVCMNVNILRDHPTKLNHIGPCYVRNYVKSKKSRC